MFLQMSMTSNLTHNEMFLPDFLRKTIEELQINDKGKLVVYPVVNEYHFGLGWDLKRFKRPIIKT